MKHAMFWIESSACFPIASWAPLPLRLIVGLGFMEHGYAKLARGPEVFADIQVTWTSDAGARRPK